MDLGLLMQPVHDPKKRSITQMLRQDREAALYADSLGFDEIWVGEHYSCDIEPITSPLQFLASIMSSTKMKLATGVLCLPQHNPAQLAGDIALLDHMSEGRVIIGAGAGGLPSDWELYDTASKNRAEMFDEAMGMMKAIWSQDPPYNLKGKYWTVKIEDSFNPRLRFGPMMKPYQKPHPEIVLSLLTPNSKTAFLAGSNGWGIASIHFMQAKWVRSHWDQYAAGCEKAGLRPDRNRWRVGRSILITDTDAEAADYLAREDNPYAWYYNFVISNKPSVTAGFLKQDLAMPDEAVTIKYCLDTMVFSGSPKTVLDRLVGFIDEIGGPFGGLLLGFVEWDQPEIEKRSMRLLAEIIMPKLRNYSASKMAAE